MSSNIYTRGGDKGETSLADGSRTPKDSLRVETYGTIDEANSWIGLCLCETSEPLLAKTLEFLQHRLYNCSSNVATKDRSRSVPSISEQDISFLEGAIDAMEAKTGPITCFVLPGGSKLASLLHVSRTICRRAERLAVGLGRTEAIDPLVLKFLNRSSDVLFAASRYANVLAGLTDAAWNKDLPPPKL